jgi:hypothetical protein
MMQMNYSQVDLPQLVSQAVAHFDVFARDRSITWLVHSTTYKVVFMETDLVVQES